VLNASDWLSNDPVLDLIAGDYTLVVGDATDRLGTYAFQLLSAASAEQITLGETVTGRPSDRDAGLAAHILPSTAPVAAGPGDTMLRLSQGGPVVTVADDAALRPQALTIETWLRPDAFRQWDTVLMKSSTGSWQDGYGLYLDGSGNLDFFVNSYLRHVVVAPKLRKVLRRAMAITFGSIAALIGVLFLVPAPLRTDAEGVVWLPDEAHVRARTSGFVEAAPVPRGARVEPGRTRLLRTPSRAENLDEALALVREVSGRTLGKRHYTVQLMGALALLEGRLVEMATGEGKTLTAAPAAVVAALSGMPVHVVTVNDYLAARDAEELSPISCSRTGATTSWSRTRSRSSTSSPGASWRTAPGRAASTR